MFLLTLPEINSSPLKMDGFQVRNLLFPQGPPFSGERNVRFREGFPWKMWVEKTLQEDGPISRRLVFDEVVKAKTWKVTDDYWKLGWGKRGAGVSPGSLK